MSNMSYCRFHNTLIDFRDCASILEEMAGNEDVLPLSDDEFACAVTMLTEMETLIEMLKEKRESRALETMSELLENLNDNLKAQRQAAEDL